ARPTEFVTYLRAGHYRGLFARSKPKSYSQFKNGKKSQTGLRAGAARRSTPGQANLARSPREGMTDRARYRIGRCARDGRAELSRILPWTAMPHASVRSVGLTAQWRYQHLAVIFRSL